MGRRLRKIFDLLHPDLSDKVEQKQSKITQPHSTVRIFSTGDKIYAKNYSGSPSWLPGTILRVTDHLSYHVETEIHRHADQLCPRSLETPKQLTPISEKEKDIPDDDVLIFQYELLYKLILLIKCLHLLDLPHLLLLFPYVAHIEKDNCWNASVHMFILKEEECEIFHIYHFLIMNVYFVFCYKCACIFL